jgi:hypothetical protein
LSSSGALTTFAWIIVMLMGGCGLVVCLSFWGGVSRRWPQPRQWLQRLPKAELIERAVSAARQFGKQPSALVQIFGLSMALNVFCVLQIMALAEGLNVTISKGALFVIVPMIVCLSALTISPSGLGVRENLYVLMLGVGQIGVDATAALSISLLAYSGSLLWSIFGGFVYLTRRERDHLQEIANSDPVSETPE